MFQVQCSAICLDLVEVAQCFPESEEEFTLNKVFLIISIFISSKSASENPEKNSERGVSIRIEL